MKHVLINTLWQTELIAFKYKQEAELLFNSQENRILGSAAWFVVNKRVFSRDGYWHCEWPRGNRTAGTGVADGFAVHWIEGSFEKTPNSRNLISACHPPLIKSQNRVVYQSANISELRIFMYKMNSLLLCTQTQCSIWNYVYLGKLKSHS